MTNLQDYVRWRGDITFAERPFNVVDNLVLSALSYLDLEEVVPATTCGDSVTVAQAAQLMKNREVRDPLLSARLNVVPESLLTDMAQAARYRDALLSDFVDIIDDAEGRQFSALTVRLADGSAFVAYRGTDNTIMGWQEDMTMSFQVMPAQRSALEYLAAAASRWDGPLRVGGHSKGGNLAVYAAMLLPAHAQGAVVAVYSNDGPGLSPEVQDANGLARIEDRVVRVVPEFAVIGMLFERQPRVRVVASSARDLMQHDLMTWQVEGADVCEVPSVSPRAAAVNAAFDSWLEQAGLEDRRSFTDSLFGALRAGGATLTTQIAQVEFGSFESVLLALARTRAQTRRPLGQALRVVWRTAAAIDYRSVWRQRASIRLFAVVAMGAFFIVVPKLAVQVLGSFAAFLAVMWLAAHVGGYVRRFGRRHHVPRRLLVALALLLLVVLAAMSWVDAVVIPTNLLLGACFLVNAWSNAQKSISLFHHSSRQRLRAVLLLVGAVVSMLVGIVALATADRVLTLFVIQAGSYCVVAGMVGLLLQVRDQAALDRSVR